MNKTKLEEGEVICSKCEGEGWVKKDAAFPSLPGFSPRCSKCNGQGKLDWVSNIMGEIPHFHNLLSRDKDDRVQYFLNANFIEEDNGKS